MSRETHSACSWARSPRQEMATWAVLFLGLLPGQGGGRGPGAHLQENPLRVLPKNLDALGKPNRGPHVPGPVARVKGLAVADPIGRDRGDERNPGRGKLDSLDHLEHGRHGRVHHGGVEGVGGVEYFGRYVLLFQFFYEALNQLVRA